ncbi:c-type cytochrome [Cupriavidus taiwanensis]|uniref:c-type cytochrome n=1 Tax=Cupriavidus taiwanensis TaxID=164546 RepID=UPI000E1058B2|nr:Cytochrome c-551 [Cupriavidus taiwanensis]SOY70011.1 Cytochrome c-551 [Cupriavidus taiwanensis]SOY95377.1 Cytochrome c-551 [Cupriavidus taiwanensis]SOZ28451.1 Cytochrome c-551 [Cupriavidus taiwanensis]SOZ72017.1 Cytochrome c-551 [Cupriavidus taiwanensis]
MRTQPALRALLAASGCLLTFGTAMPAHASQALASSKACLACHATDKKLVGPAFQDIKGKYTGRKDAQAQMVQSILKGSSGRWGPVPMPANAVSEADANTLAKWILSL